MIEDLTPIQRQSLIDLARRSVAIALGIETSTPRPSKEFDDEYCGAFVTIRKEGSLRGCIGSMASDRSLSELIPEIACSSSFRDPRFKPVDPSEFDELKFEISLLSPMIKITDLDEIEIGRDGLYVKSSRGTGVLLPQVATEYGWNRDEFLSHVCRKAGLPPNAYLDTDVALYRFSAVLCQ